MSKKILAGLILAGILSLVGGSYVLARPVTGVSPEVLPTWSATGVLGLITRITNWIFTFLIAVVVIMVLVSAYLFVTAGGNPDQQARARSILIYALIGFAVGMIARGIIALVSAVIGKTAEWRW